ncbi:2-amino-4-hydroxy-6-hydroxymethyldihydropteridine diphosphokinase [Anaeromyxobacter paludicola]|uniref:2-amino-4-hydroxy-6-hydroxymethyldihydropteridine pyrophosphokinase n=1 Tax=Anaeromyxobacter paludicola TaxID=2918171 RepID=A0ABN6N873_9BACT|nr:2-amino-4-hydroxy-6-hydroxymethyldihydropteridine diphosphokinase [Anaeromyxobacter paludicola]BDG09401.1 2-amino-4-hydroxy-6-hydroxymethyldihydropteridine diphosphokinase [Anaeromyxobacter paludicola]
MRAYVGVGSNLGDRWAHLALGARQLRAAPRVSLLRASRAYDSEPVGPPQPRYLNAVLELETELTAPSLHALLQLTERAAGRRYGTPRWSARTLDLDVLLYGTEVVRTPRLVVPHPHLVSRRFVLLPLSELAPGLEIPGTGRTVAQLLQEAPPLDLFPAGRYPL